MRYIFGLMRLKDRPWHLQDKLTELPALIGEPTASTHRDWTIISCAFEGSEILPKRRYMLAHTKIVEELMPFGTVLPARFGLLADSLDALKALIDQKEHALEQAFDRVDGSVELGVRIEFDRSNALQDIVRRSPALSDQRQRLLNKGAEAHFERAELGRLMAERLDQERTRLQRVLLEKIAKPAKAHVLRAPEDDVEALRAEFLVKDTEATAFVDHVETTSYEVIDPSFAPLRIRIVGPAPVYNFVSLDLSTPAQMETT